QIEERRRLQAGYGPLVLVGELRREGIPGDEERPGGSGARPQHLGDPDRLADGPSESEQARRDHTSPPVRPGGTAGHLPERIAPRVAPSASAPCSSSSGTPTKSSRQTLDVIGMTMIVSTRIATRTPEFCGLPLKSGMKPR